MKSLLSTALITLLAASSATAGTITIDFEGPSSYLWIDQYYNGGTDGNGLSGPNFGVSFGLDDLALQNDILGPYFSNAPSPIGIMTVVGPETAMNVPGGFRGISFYYSASIDMPAGVQVWSGLNGTGSLLASFDLTKNSDDSSSGTLTPYDHWDLLSAGGWGAGAHSVTFTGAVYYAGFDDISFTPAPEPASIVLFGLGLVSCLPMLLRRRRSAKCPPNRAEQSARRSFS